MAALQVTGNDLGGSLSLSLWVMEVGSGVFDKSSSKTSLVRLEGD